MHGELCIHLVIPTGGMTAITLRFFKDWFKENDSETGDLFGIFFFFCFLLFKVTLWFILITFTSIFIAPGNEKVFFCLFVFYFFVCLFCCSSNMIIKF